MLFWLIVAVVVAAVLLYAWRSDRRRKVTIDRRKGEVETDIADAWFEVNSNRVRRGGFGGPPA